MSFQVSLTDGASSDVRSILRWIEERSSAGALSWYRAWQKVLQSLRERADKFGLAPESEDHPEPIFQVVFKTRRGRPYRALFINRDRDVFVLHVRGPGQNLLDPDEIRKPG
jgi:plasmid stabilization system protein ParE